MEADLLQCMAAVLLSERQDGCYRAHMDISRTQLYIVLPKFFRKGNEEGTTNPSKENDWGRRGRAASAHLKSEAVAAVTGVVGGRGRGREHAYLVLWSAGGGSRSPKRLSPEPRASGGGGRVRCAGAGAASERGRRRESEMCRRRSRERGGGRVRCAGRRQKNHQLEASTHRSTRENENQ
jgi:hypothetical protein